MQQAMRHEERRRALRLSALAIEPAVRPKPLRSYFVRAPVKRLPKAPRAA